VQVSASYTFSKALDYGMNQTQQTDTNDQTDPFTVLPDYGISANDIPNRFVGNLTLMPAFAAKNHIVSLLINGWTMAPVWTVQSGVPYSYGLTSGSAIAGAATTYNGSGGIGGGVAQYVNFGAYPQYASADVLNGGGVRRDSVRQTTIDDVDLRLSRSLTFHEKYQFTLGGEAFNLLNRENFTAFNTTAYSLSVPTATPNVATATYQSSFGTPSGAGNTIYRERQIQFIGRFEF
jgi:hypothetical protein